MVGVFLNSGISCQILIEGSLHACVNDDLMAVFLRSMAYVSTTAQSLAVAYDKGQVDWVV